VDHRHPPPSTTGETGRYYSAAFGLEPNVGGAGEGACS
jgi:hypothetical protein